MSSQEPSHSSSGSDRRRHRRRPTRISVRYRSANDFLSAYTENISASGVFIATEHMLPPGTELEVDITFPGLTEPISLKGIVRWVVSSPSVDQLAGIGVEFTPDPATGASVGTLEPPADPSQA